MAAHTRRVFLAGVAAVPALAAVDALPSVGPATRRAAAERWIRDFRAEGGDFHWFECEPGAMRIGVPVPSSDRMGELLAALEGRLRRDVKALASTERTGRSA